MNNKKICFITCVNDKILYDECLKYINSLYIPAGFQIETLNVENAISMTSGYNAAMKDTDAKYKVYLHQDTYIINKNFIFDILNIFKKSKNIGMIGVSGAKFIPTSGMWWESSHKFGQVYENHTGLMKLLAFNTVNDDYTDVRVVDGLMMATQYDVPWREDVFDGWDFYDISQCVEFSMKGYRIVVPAQKKPWCIHDCGFVNTGNVTYELYRNKFLDEYSRSIFPLVSIMITAYNRPVYFETALKSAINQTYRNIEIVICDNSTNDSCKYIAQKYLNINSIRYYKNNKELKVIDNFNKCISFSRGEYVEFLMDDDIYNVEKTSKMMNYFIEYDDLSLVTSYRQTIDENGRKMSPIKATRKVFDKDTKIEGKYFRKLILSTLTNYIGETTTPLFKKKDLQNGKFGIYDSIQYECISDMVTWFYLLGKGNIVYISEPLSFFRIHDSQDQKRINTIVLGVVEQFKFIESAFKDHFIIESEYKQNIFKYINLNLYAFKYLDDKNCNNLDLNKFKLLICVFKKALKIVYESGNLYKYDLGKYTGYMECKKIIKWIDSISSKYLIKGK
jgi:glycosyltransferase involved in cell wall biosynthesis